MNTTEFIVLIKDIIENNEKTAKFRLLMSDFKEFISILKEIVKLIRG